MLISRFVVCAISLLVTIGSFGSSATAAERSFSGVASFYSYSDGKLANGKRFDPHALTAAHRTLPFGTHVRLTDPKSGKSVVVTINDRGPSSKGRVIDVSLGAARVLQMLDRGVIYVRADVL
jgi:rare lipoprotein A